MGLEPTTPCLQISLTRTTANADGLLRLVSGLTRTLAYGTNGYGRDHSVTTRARADHGRWIAA